ncbi:hypothetical protein dsat_1071 [Alkalidesulfovibrio alkalitolerans DSM 16529]|uniref:Lipase class 3 n=1 Tax=Alkalidesulfovibrio alkalitolerans DSM 16529 TaxID=1121439 RepID=S7UAI8_9BACT|nr:DUF2974 domain-containing protein [Alkalidesulfovibrio alkalitolerans]EPR30944.1 hypothetical protein dsat_1071 [Alkalidesulfovibrio alkalitolerans DSM 16529]
MDFMERCGDFSLISNFAYAYLSDDDERIYLDINGKEYSVDEPRKERDSQLFSEITQDYNILAVEEDGATGLGAVLLQDKSDPSRKVVAFRGTEIGGKVGGKPDGNTDMGDMSANAAILTGRTPEQAKAASRLLERYREEGLISAEDRLDLAGHSLGGFIAEYVAATNPESVNAAVTFNSPGAAAHVGKVDPSVKDKIINVHAAEGPSPVSGFGPHVGKRIAVPGSSHGIADLRTNLQATKEAAERHNAEVAQTGQGAMIDLSTPEALNRFTQAMQRQTMEPRISTDEFGNSIPGAHHRGWAWQLLGDPEIVRRAAEAAAKGADSGPGAAETPAATRPGAARRPGRGEDESDSGAALEHGHGQGRQMPDGAGQEAGSSERLSLSGRNRAQWPGERTAAGRTRQGDFFWRKGSVESNVNEKFWRDHAPEGQAPGPGSAARPGRESPVQKLPGVSGEPGLPNRPDMTAQQPRARTLEYRPDEDKQESWPFPYRPGEDGQRSGPRAPRPAPGQGDAAKLPWWADEEPPAAKGQGRAPLPAQNVPPGYAGMLMPPPISLRRERAEAGALGNGAMATVDYLRELFAEQYRRR